MASVARKMDAVYVADHDRNDDQKINKQNEPNGQSVKNAVNALSPNQNAMDCTSTERDRSLDGECSLSAIEMMSDKVDDHGTSQSISNHTENESISGESIIDHPESAILTVKMKKAPKALSEEQYLNHKHRETAAAKAVLKRQEPRDRVVIFDRFVADSESIDMEQRMVYHFESHLVQKAEYPLFLIFKRFRYYPINNTNSMIMYYGDALSVLIVGLGKLGGNLMNPPDAIDLLQCKDEMDALIHRIQAADQWPETKGLWTSLLNETQKVLSSDGVTSIQSRQFIKYLWTTKVPEQKRRDAVSLTVNENMLDIFRRFVLVTWKVMVDRLLLNIGRFVKESKLGIDGKITVRLKEIYFSLSMQFEPIRESLDILLRRIGLVSANHFEDFVVRPELQDFDTKSNGLDAVLSIGEAIYKWRSSKHHGAIAICAGCPVSESWEIGQMLHALGYKENQISRYRAHYDLGKGYYYKSFTPSKVIEDEIQSRIITSKSRLRRQRKKRRGNETTSTGDNEGDRC